MMGQALRLMPVDAVRRGVMIARSVTFENPLDALEARVKLKVTRPLSPGPRWSLRGILSTLIIKETDDMKGGMNNNY